MNIQTDDVIEHRWPDFAVPADARVEEKEQEKMDRY